MSNYQLVVLSIVLLLCILVGAYAYFTGQAFDAGVFFAMAAAVFWFVLGDIPDVRTQKHTDISHSDCEV